MCIKAAVHSLAKISSCNCYGKQECPINGTNVTVQDDNPSGQGKPSSNVAQVPDEAQEGNPEPADAEMPAAESDANVVEVCIIMPFLKPLATQDHGLHVILPKATGYPIHSYCYGCGVWVYIAIAARLPFRVSF